MKRLNFLVALLAGLTFSLINPQNYIALAAKEKIDFWDQSQKKGANIFNRQIAREDIKAAKSYNIAFIRLTPDKFLSAQRDFLIGDADNYTGLVAEDLKELIKILDICAEEQMPVVLTMLSLPGSRWKQNNNDKDDLRIWNDVNFQQQAAKFWKDFAAELQDHPAIIGYNILNEPHLERLYNTASTHIHETRQEEVQQKLFDFYKLVIANIRSSDKTTPIILDSSAYGDPKTFRHFKIHNDTNILYSFHMYEPYEYTNQQMNKGKFSYPGKIHNTYWNKEALNSYTDYVRSFQKTNNIPSNRILVGEFGGHRTSKGLPDYFRDLMNIFNKNGWHFAFYAFREDVWDGMDYELGDKKLPWEYWQAVEKGETPKLDRNPDNPVFKVLKEVYSEK